MLRGFAPIHDEYAKVLILGTGPSVRSLQKMQYYGHERNAFWPIMQLLFSQESTTYAEKQNLLLVNQIALWDVLSSFEREGSLDSSYTDTYPNDLKSFLLDHPRILKVLFNGKKAESLYKKHINYYPEHIAFHALCSTSPAYTLPFEEKVRMYREALLDQEVYYLS